MKVKTIYIDNYAGEEDRGFVEKLKARLQLIKAEFNVITFNDLLVQSRDWEEKTLGAIDNAEIIIPIISADYLSWVTPPIETRFSHIIDNKNKYLFPIYFRPANWSSFSWIVKSNIIPEDYKPLAEYDIINSDKIINNLVSKIERIILSAYDSIIPSLVEVSLKSNKSVFISHDHEDGDFAELLKLKLEAEGINCWIDSERLKIGQDWREEIDEGIKKSIAVITIMTPEARKSEYVTYEWAFAWGKGIKIFPIMLKQTQLHPRLESLQYLDFTNRNTRTYDKLISSLKYLIN